MEKTLEDSTEISTPKVFISYSWTNQQHQEQVREWADRLLSDGVDVTFDIYDLQEGQDKNAFMERMVTDPNVTHVLVICDKGYAEKADARKQGVGTESQIISQKVYNQVEQTKFIPVVCEFKDDGTPYLPTFLQSRIWIDFSSLEAVNSNWEQLIRRLYGKPIHKKPKIGTPPVYLNDTAAPLSPARSQYDLLHQAILDAKPGVPVYRQRFLDACIEYADELRVREQPDEENLGEKVLEDCGKLILVRDHIVDWVLLESEVASSEDFSEALIDFLEKLLELKARPVELNPYNNDWLEAHGFFVFETFLYIVAALLKTRAFKDLNNVFKSHYILSPTERHRVGQFVMFDGFIFDSKILNPILAPKGQKLTSPAAELVKRQANRKDVPFPDLIQADLLILLMGFIIPDTWWSSQLMYYSSYGTEFPFFIRASQHKHFANLATITGITDPDTLREKFKEGVKGLDLGQQRVFFRQNWTAMNMDNLDTIK